MSHENNLIRTMVRGIYDLQKTRIQMGNRVTGNFKAKLGQSPDGMTEAELAKEQKKILDMLRSSYKRITDGVVKEGQEPVDGKLPSIKKFVGDEIISKYTELVLVSQYMTLLNDEEKQFRQLGNVLKGIPIYDEFLADVKGVGTAMAAIIISEIDITKAEYPSSLWKYAGLDAVQVGYYTDETGKEHTVHMRQIEAMIDPENPNKPLLMMGKYPITFGSVGRSRKEFCLEKREYINKDGEEAIRDSITFNPFLKTKLIGVLGSSFLRSGSVTVNDKRMGGAKRLELAESKGFKADPGDDKDDQVISFLREIGYNVVVELGPYGEAYYNYKNRLQNDQRHADKTDLHRHNMAVRFAVKRFLVDLYSKWRALEGLPVATEYSEGKLGMIHKKA